VVIQCLPGSGSALSFYSSPFPLPFISRDGKGVDFFLGVCTIFCMMGEARKDKLCYRMPKMASVRVEMRKGVVEGGHLEICPAAAAGMV
jgi:hypothetical protein